jgi:FkbM family methyltransferase
MPRLLQNSLRRFVERRFHVPSIEWSLVRLRDLGFSHQSIIDVGAFVGAWSVMAYRIFPSVSVLMLEAQERLGSRLGEVARSCAGKATYQIALLGAEEQEGVVFHEYETAPTASSVLQDGKGSPSRRAVCRLRTLDGILRETGLPPPEFIKLDGWHPWLPTESFA